MTARPDITPDSAFTPIPSQEQIDRRAREDAAKNRRTRWDFVAVWFVLMPALWAAAVWLMWSAAVQIGRALMEALL